MKDSEFCPEALLMYVAFISLEVAVQLVCITVVEFIETTTFSVAVISTSGS